MNAQVDYLVSEMRGGFHALNGRLNAPNVTVDGASDDVLNNFERPAVINQATTNARRGFSRHALAVYQAAHPPGPAAPAQAPAPPP
jgi:hypothetical protein